MFVFDKTGSNLRTLSLLYQNARKDVFLCLIINEENLFPQFEKYSILEDLTTKCKCVVRVEAWQLVV